MVFSAKGDGDTITRLDDICQERIGIRTDITIASIRDLLNSGIVFHRLIQIVTSQDPSEYPTLYHFRNAASKRYTTKKSLKLLTNILLERAEIGAAVKKEKMASFELANCCPSPAEPPMRKSARQAALGTPAVCLPCVAGISGKTPGKGQSINKPSAEYVLRCKQCDGIYPAKKILEGNTTNRVSCRLCGRLTSSYCFGCRRQLCFQSPKGGKDREGNKYPKQFTVRVPKLAEDGSVVRDADNGIVFVEEFGELTCWHIAHGNHWKRTMENGSKAAVVSQQKKAVSEEKQSPSEAIELLKGLRKSKRKKSGGNT